MPTPSESDKLIEPIEDVALAAMGPRIAKQSLQDAVYWKLRKALQDGVFRPGQKLTNRQLAESIGYSVTPVREAIRRLVSEGALRELPNGSVVAPQTSPREFIDEIGWMLVTLESRAVSLAVPRLSVGDVIRLETLFEQAREACEGGDRIRANALFREFYFSIFARAEQPVLLSILDMLWLRVGSLHRIVFPEFTKREQGRHYQEMIEAARRRDATGAVLAIAAFHARLEAYLLAMEPAPEGEPQGGQKPRRKR